MRIVGVDCATDPSRVRLSLGEMDSGTVTIEEVTTASVKRPPAEIIKGWLEGSTPSILALDAPLGWPAAMGQALHGHEAGQPLSPEPNELFRRITDRVIHAQTGRQPLDVGSNWIARTAFAALRLLETLGALLGSPIPLSWDPKDITRVSAIEVYPAATLSVYSLQHRGYKAKDQLPYRKNILKGLSKHLSLPVEKDLLYHSPDAMDAVVCVLAGADYLRGLSISPPEDGSILKEGWIWVRSPNQ